MKNIKILIADELPIISHGLKKLLHLQLEIEYIEEISSFKGVLEKLKNDNFDVLISDIVFENKLVINELQEIRNFFPTIKILITTQYLGNGLIETLNKIGIDNFILKGEKVEEFVWAVYTIIHGDYYFSDRSDEVSSKDILRRDDLRQVLGIELTPREYKVLDLLAQGHTTNDISNMLFISTNTVETHRKHLIAKFETKNVAGLIKKACQYGLIDYFSLQLLFFAQMIDVIC